MNARTNNFDPVEIDAVAAMIYAVDRKGREMDDKWGIGRLPSLVPVEWAERFGRQKAKMTQAAWSYEPEAVKAHSESMIRAYEKLDQLATEAGHKPGAPDVWEFMIDDQLVRLVRDIATTNLAKLEDGRACQVWSLDEIANVIRNHPVLAAAKQGFPGATVESVRPPRAVVGDLNDSLEGTGL